MGVVRDRVERVSGSNWAGGEGGGVIDNYVNGESVWIELGTGGAGQRQ